MKNNPTIILSTAYLPPAGYFKVISESGEVFIEQYETYPKQTYRNRCEIATANGKLPLTIPVQRVNGNHTLTKDIRISYDEKWQMIHWRTIESAYANSPYFLYYADALKTFYENKTTNLVAFNSSLLEVLFNLIGIRTKIQYTSHYLKHYENATDLRLAFSPKHPGFEAATQPYYQVFGSKHGFIPGLSIIDLLFNMGPGALACMMNE